MTKEERKTIVEVETGHTKDEQNTYKLGSGAYKVLRPVIFIFGLSIVVTFTIAIIIVAVILLD